MKSYNHLWEKFLSDENIKLAVKNMLKGKRHRLSVIRFLESDDIVGKIRRYASQFKNANHHPVEIYDGIQRKKRKIIVPNVFEQIVHHMVVNVLQPIFMKGMYEHSYGSIPKRGGHRAMRRLKRRIKKGGRNYKYCLKMDIKKYFDSIPIHIIVEKLERIIHDEKFLKVVKEILSVVECGIPLGFYTSQWLANWYLQDLDRFIKEKLGAKEYVRYMDDMVIFDGAKRKLHRIRKAIAEYLREKLGLKMKEDWQVFLFHFVKKDGREVGRCLDFMGFKFYRNRVTLRKSIMLKSAQKARRIYRKEKPTVYDMRQMMSYLGWIDATDAYGMYEDRIKPIVSFKKCRQRISSHDRKHNREVARCGGNHQAPAA